MSYYFSLIYQPRLIDTVDHQILISRLRTRFGIKGNVLRWFESYLYDRKQFVQIDGIRSVSKDLQCDVPQGSVLGPILYVLYTAPLGDIIRSHGLSFHFYADDCQVYVSFEPTPEGTAAAISTIEACARDVDTWMLCNKFKLNRGKTELLVLSAQHRPRPHILDVTVADAKIFPSISARNIGVIFDQSMNLEQQVQNVCKTAFYHIRNIAKIRNCLSQNDTETLVHAFISSKLDNCNSLLTGLPIYLIEKLQRVQNAAARLVTRT